MTLDIPSTSTLDSATLPVLDLSRLSQGDAEAEAFRVDLREATHDYGFFYLTGHGVPQQLIDDVMAVSRRFFDLPEADKMAIENIRSPHFRGYTRVGGELTQGKVDWREQIDIGTDRISIPFFYAPALDSTIPVLTLPEELAAQARGITVDPGNPIFTTYGENAFKSRLRAHPDVAAIHHSDLVEKNAAAAAQNSIA